MTHRCGTMDGSAGGQKRGRKGSTEQEKNRAWYFMDFLTIPMASEGARSYEKEEKEEKKEGRDLSLTPMRSPTRIWDEHEKGVDGFNGKKIRKEEEEETGAHRGQLWRKGWFNRDLPRFLMALGVLILVGKRRKKKTRSNFFLSFFLDGLSGPKSRWAWSRAQ